MGFVVVVVVRGPACCCQNSGLTSHILIITPETSKGWHKIPEQSLLCHATVHQASTIPDPAMKEKDSLGLRTGQRGSCLTQAAFQGFVNKGLETTDRAAARQRNKAAGNTF